MQNVSTLIELIYKKKENQKLWISLSYILQKDKEEIINFCNIMKNKINSGVKPDILLALFLIDFTVDSNNYSLWEKIDSNDFLSCITNILKNNPDEELQSICLYLIKKLADKFKNYPSLQNCQKVKKSLKDSKVNFPQSLKHSYIDILQSKNGNNNNINNKNNNNNINNLNIMKENINNSLNSNNNININHHKNNICKTQYKIIRKSRIPSNPENYLTNLNLNQNNFDKKYTRLIGKLNETTQLIQQINLLINKNINRKYKDNISIFCEKLKTYQEKLIKYIQSSEISDEKLMSICLAVIEDINMTINRYEKFKKGENPGPFLTSFSRDNNPYYDKNKININKTFNFGENHGNILDKMDLGESVKTIFLNDGENGNNIMENSLNVMFGNIEKSEIIDPTKNINQNNNGNKSTHFFNKMSQFSQNGDDINNSSANNNSNILDKNINFLNDSNVMIIGNKIINNNVNNNNSNFKNNSLSNHTSIENKGNEQLFNNLLLNDRNIKDNKTTINNKHNNTLNTNIHNNYNNNMHNNINSIKNNMNSNINNNMYNNNIYHKNNNIPNNIYNDNNINRNQTNNNYNNIYNTQFTPNFRNINLNNINNNNYNNFYNPQNKPNNLSRTQFFINQANFNNKK